MAVHVEGLFDKSTRDEIYKSKLLVVGAGGIGCELLKTLVLTGFEDIHVIDLDTIELSNLNRQFLFHKQHIGRPKAVVAKESVLKFNPKAKIVAYHDSITNTQYNVEFFRQFSLVTNALDNVAARSHVNRMCMAADIPLIESGSAGYIGQVTVYKKKLTECFECLPKKPQRTYPGCTIRNTPSEPVHCIVWAKHLFNQLFGETDAEQEVSPDFADPELEGSPVEPNETGNINRISTREWAKGSFYDSNKIFTKLFSDDIKYLNQMNALWEKRCRPIPLVWGDLPDAVPGCSQQRDGGIKDQVQWSTKQCAEIFQKSLNALKHRAEEAGSDGILLWDKDDEHCMDFVAACANLRAFCFHIPQLSKFDIKAIAGNIVPAVAATNAIIAGLIVLQVLKALRGEFEKCRTTWINETYVTSCRLISSGQLEKPNPNCFVCSPKTPEVLVRLNMKTLSVKTLEEKILKEKLHMVQPDVVINDGSGKILISSDPDDIEGDVMGKPLSDFGLSSHSRLLCEDFFQHYKVLLVVIHGGDVIGQEFEIESDVKDLKPQENESPTVSHVTTPEELDATDIESISDDIIVMDKSPAKASRKKVADDENGMQPPTKKAKPSSD